MLDIIPARSPNVKSIIELIGTKAKDSYP